MGYEGENHRKIAKEAPLEFIVFDLELTAWEGSLQRHWAGPNEFREIVEIGAVRTDPEKPDIQDQCFSMLVHPVKNPLLSNYFIELTGISQQRLEHEGQSLSTALEAFAEFASGVSHFYAYGDDGDIIAENCGFQGLHNPLAGSRITNVRAGITKAYGLNTSITSADLPTATGLAKSGDNLQAHNALDDARAVAQVLKPLIGTPGFSL